MAGASALSRNGLGSSFPPKDDNPTNEPQIRPIEALWAALKQLVYANNWEADSLDELGERITQVLAEMYRD